jgi:hypothetical protein
LSADLSGGGTPAIGGCMIRKSGYRFSEKIMHKQQDRAGWRFVVALWA